MAAGSDARSRKKLHGGSDHLPLKHMARRLRFDEAVDSYLAHLKVERGLSRNTLDGYGRDLARLGDYVGDRDVDDVTTENLTDYLIRLAEAKLAARSRARALV